MVDKYIGADEVKRIIELVNIFEVVRHVGMKESPFRETSTRTVTPRGRGRAAGSWARGRQYSRRQLEGCPRRTPLLVDRAGGERLARPEQIGI